MNEYLRCAHARTTHKNRKVSVHNSDDRTRVLVVVISDEASHYSELFHDMVMLGWSWNLHVVSTPGARGMPFRELAYWRIKHTRLSSDIDPHKLARSPDLWSIVDEDVALVLTEPSLVMRLLRESDLMWTVHSDFCSLVHREARPLAPAAVRALFSNVPHVDSVVVRGSSTNHECMLAFKNTAL